MKALVLKKTPYGESDLIIQFFCEDGQVRSGFAAGARKSKKRFSHHFHIAGIYEVEWASSSNKLSRIHRCELLECLFFISDKLETLNRWMMVIEWISVDEMEGFQFEEVLTLMRSLESEEGLTHYHQFFVKQIMRHGLRPQLNECVVCHKPVERTVFSLQEGGLSHKECAPGESLSEPSLSFLKACFEEKGKGQKLSRHSLEELDQITLPYLELQLERSLKSRRVFEKLLSH